MYRSLLRNCSIPLAVGMIAMASTAIADDLSPTVSCLNGEVAAFDFAELQENFREGVWDRRAGVQLVSQSESVTLKVIDYNNNSICENVADLRTRCNFSLRVGDDFSIQVTNLDGPVAVRYQLCAY